MALLKPMLLGKDANRFPMQNVLNACDHIDARVLAANTAEAHTVPTGATHVVFSGTADFYVNYGGTAAVPAADVTNGSASELNPMAREIRGITSLGLISASTCIVTMCFYKHDA